jgi:hypothetical protein
MKRHEARGRPDARVRFIDALSVFVVAGRMVRPEEIFLALCFPRPNATVTKKTRVHEKKIWVCFIV